MTGRLAILGTLLAASVLASCASPTPGGAEKGTPTGTSSGTGITFFGDARLGVAYGPDRPGGKPRTRLVAE